MRVVLYRLHYGFQYLYQSINSVSDWADRIVVVISKEPWYKKKTVEYLGKTVEIKHPEDIEYHSGNLKYIPKVEVYFREFTTSQDHWGKIIREFATGEDYVLTMECDWVISKPEQLWEFEKIASPSQYAACAGTIEYWRNAHWRIPLRAGRTGPTLFASPGQITTVLNNDSRDIRRSFVGTDRLEVKNFGFCWNPEIVLYKHLLTLGSSRDEGMDAAPYELWYELWYNWTPETENLEISAKQRHTIKRAYPVVDGGDE